MSACNALRAPGVMDCHCCPHFFIWFQHLLHAVTLSLSVETFLIYSNIGTFVSRFISMFTPASSFRRGFTPMVVMIGLVSLQEAQEQKAMITQLTVTVCSQTQVQQCGTNYFYVAYFVFAFLLSFFFNF